MKWKRDGNRSVSGSEPSSAFSRGLRQVTRLIGERDFENALERLSSALATAQTPDQKARILALVAKTQELLGRDLAASEQYAAAAQLGSRPDVEQDAWLEPALGEVRTLLKAQSLDDALSRSRAIERKAAERESRFNALASTTTSQLQQTGTVRIGARPTRLSVARTRLGVTFLTEGYADEASEVLTKAVAKAPSGASRARQILANIRAREGRFDLSERLARESLVLGKFQAKTIASWPILLRARFSQGKPALDEETFATLLTARRGSVCARAVLCVVAQLRGYRDARWQTIARDWLAKREHEDQVITFEIRKMLLAEHRRSPDKSSSVLALSRELIKDPLIAKREVVGVAKAFAESSLATEKTEKSLVALGRDIRKRHGDLVADSAIHAMSLGAMVAKRYDVARELLTRHVTRLDNTSEQWGKSVWALARMEGLLENHSREAALYLTITAQTAVPQRFRIQALLRWVRAAEKSGKQIAVADVRAQVLALVSSLTDYQILLDVARQLALAGRRFKDIQNVVADRGEQLAIDAFNVAATAPAAIVILNHLARRQFYDLSRSRALIRFWESLSDQKIAWLWSPAASYWEYISLVIRAYFNVGQDQRGEELANEILADSGTPEIGRVYASSHFGQCLVQRDRLPDAFALFDRLRSSNPSHRLAAAAHYWAALREYRAGRITPAIDAARFARKSLEPAPSLLTEWALDSRAGLLLLLLGVDKKLVDLSRYEPRFLNQQSQALERDARRL